MPSADSDRTRKIFGHSTLVVLIAWTGARLTAADTVDSVHRTAVEWAKLREEKARVDSEWAHERDLMEATIPAMREKLQLLEERRALTEAQTATARRDADQEAIKGAALVLSLEKTKVRLLQTSRELLQLRASLPPRLSRALEFAFASLADEALSPAERMRSVITVLERCAQFNGAVTLSEEALSMEGAKEKVMEVLYWGLAQAYALDRNGNQAYIGRPGTQGWVWESHPEAVQKISAAIDVHRDAAEPRFVSLPVKIGAKAPSTKAD